METIMQKILTRQLESNGNELNIFLNALGARTGFIIEELSKVDNRYFYDSFIHGRNHSEKVYFFALFLAKIKNLDPIDTRIVLDAALYHDIGRIVDSEDTVHGLTSTLRLQEKNILTNPIYKDPINLDLLYAIIEGHSLDDDCKNNNYENRFYEYDIELPEDNYERYSVLYDILKDADALDRTRFGRKSFATVDKDMLRIEESKALIEMAYEINDIYKSEMMKGFKEHTIDPTKGGFCFHSIGFDFTKVKPILEKGVLSLSERIKMNLNVPSNFEGGNTYRWISVVDVDAVKKQAGAFSTFTKHGIGFICNAEEMIEGYSNKDRGKAISDGYPYNKGGYDDEKYVYSKIDSSDILGIVIPPEYRDISLKNVKYIHNAMNMETYEASIEKYEKILAEKNIYLNRERINGLLEVYKGILQSFKKAKGREREEIRDDLPKVLGEVTKSISEEIGKGMEKYYMILTNKTNVTIADALSYEVGMSSVDAKELEPGLFSINATEKTILEDLANKLK